MNQIQLSATAIKNLQCGRKYYLANIEEWEKPEPADFLIFGRAFHHGMSVGLTTSIKSTSIDDIILAATVAANAELDMMLFEAAPNSDFSQEEIRLLLSQMLRFYLPLIGLNDKYRVAEYHEIFGSSQCGDCRGVRHSTCITCDGQGFQSVIGNGGETPVNCSECYGTGRAVCGTCEGYGQVYDSSPVVEFEFDVDLGDDVTVHGYVDAVLIDMATGEQVAVDWKTVQAVRDATTAMLDDQLHLYAAALNYIGANITRVVMWQFRKSVPKPANINKNNAPSIAAQTSIWDVWYGSLPPATKQIVDSDLQQWETWAVDKLKSEAEFNSPIESYVNEASNQVSLANIKAQADLARWIRERANTGQVVPAIADGGFNGTCQYCPFRMLCVDTLRYGSPEYVDVLESNFVKRQR